MACTTPSRWDAKKHATLARTFDLARSIRREAALGNTTLIAVTSSREDFYGRLAAQAGFMATRANPTTSSNWLR